MAYNKVILTKEDTPASERKHAPVGFSWTTFFFGFIIALVRDDWKWGVIQLILVFVTLGLSGLVFPFVYNKMYLTGLIAKGYRVVSVEKGSIDELSAKTGIALPTH